MSKRDEVWLEFVRQNLCGLCGNTGIIDTRETAVSPAGVHCGDRFHCICPNGRAMKQVAIRAAMKAVGE